MNNKYDKKNIFSKILRSEIDCDKIQKKTHKLHILDINPKSTIHIFIKPKNKNNH